MECCVCLRDFDARKQPVCVSCTQAALHGPRIQLVSTLLDREKQHIHAEAVLRPGNDGVIAALPQDADYDAIGAGIKRQAVEKAREERQVLEAKISDITKKADELRKKIEDYKEWAASQRASHARRRSEVAVEHKQLERQHPRMLDPVQTATNKAQQRLEKVHNRTVDARALLCREAALLAGLQKRRGANGKAEYWLGGAPMPDLRGLHGKDMASTVSELAETETPVEAHELISAGFDNVCRLLGNCCHYLSVRLPAEIVLPHNGIPHARMLSEKYSYKLSNTPHPSMQSSQVAETASSAQRPDRSGRPRPLYLALPLAKLLKEDPNAFQMFVEAATYLAYDIAWLCKSQGLDKITSFEDVCAIGKNVCNLFLAQEQARPPLNRNISSATTRKDRARPLTTAPAIRLGAYSHASAHHSTSSAVAAELFRNWRIPPVIRLTDALKAHLVNEISGAEWDYMSGEEWNEERQDEMPVLIGGARTSIDRAEEPTVSVMSITPNDGAGEDGGKKGSSGWMKVRGRGGEG
ncbi:hypothetical protein LTR02_015306 [Friedmanniomyces endolithicus]|nr:hypothetical protein LTR02_015306 [Friedmanniomyces endolithicus]